MILDCKPIAHGILDGLVKQAAPQTTLAAVLIGEDPASVSFLKQQKERTAQKLGVHFAIHQFPEIAKQREVEEAIRHLGGDGRVGGIILQLPLPGGYDRDALISKIPIEKDVDALRGSTLVLPPAVGALSEICKHIGFDMQRARAAVVGRGFLVGAPIAAWLSGKAKEVTAMGRDSFDAEKIGEATLVVSGTGVPGLIRGEHIRAGAVCVDFGYGKQDGMLRGDFDAATVADKAAYLTPTPGGTGPVLVAKLFENFYSLASKA